MKTCRPILPLLILTTTALAAPERVTRWDFDTDGDLQGWKPDAGLADVAVAEGRLTARITAPDAYLFSPPVDIPLDGVVIRVGLRGDRPGDTQLYWRTADNPELGEHAVVIRPTPPSPPGEIRTVEFAIGRPQDAGRRLTGFRIDPFNGNTEGQIEIDWVEVIRVDPEFDVRFALTPAHVDLGEPVTALVTVRQVSGRVTTQEYVASIGDAGGVSVQPQATRDPVAIGELRFDAPGVHTVRMELRAGPAEPTHVLEASVIVGRGERLPLKPLLRGKTVRLDLVPMAGSTTGGPDGARYGAARWAVRDASGEWQHCGWLMPLGELVTQTPDGRAVGAHLQPVLTTAGTRTARLELPHPGAWTYTLDLATEQRSPHEVIRVGTHLQAESSQQVLAFASPAVRMDREGAHDPLDRFAIFGGLEFLEPGWTSSSERAVGRHFADRWSPSPHKVSLPAMAIEADGLTTALLWRPTDAPEPPVATFASPNFLDGQQNHLAQLAVPGSGALRRENDSVAHRPLVIEAGTTLTGPAYLLHAEPDLPVARVAQRWYELFGPPAAPPPVHDDAETYELIARNYGETVYWPEENGWTHHWFFPEKPRYVERHASELIVHALHTGRTQWIERTRLAGRMIIDAAGKLAARLADDSGARQALREMQPDGTWTFVNTPEMRKATRWWTKNEYETLGEDGSSSLGTCVQPALQILHRAQLTGDPEMLRASIRALEAMRRFRVPRGAQVWEVHQQIPDIRAAALAVEAYQIGYRLTEDRRYLEDANYWAWTGVPFIYSWRVPVAPDAPRQLISSRDRTQDVRGSIPFTECFQDPERQVTPYGTIPVLGPTFYVHNWFGVIVQWCGLEWAWKVIELDADRPDPLLRTIADGVVASGLQQMFDKGPWIGLYPDVWDVPTHNAMGALIAPYLPTRCLQAQGRIPRDALPWTRVIRAPSATENQTHRPTWHISGWGDVPELRTPTAGAPLVLNLRYPRGQHNELIVCGVSRPSRVMVAGQLLEGHATDAPRNAIGWRYDDARRALSIRFEQVEPATPVQVHW